MPNPPTGRSNADGFRGEYPKYIDPETLPPARMPWLERDSDDEPAVPSEHEDTSTA